MLIENGLGLMRWLHTRDPAWRDWLWPDARAAVDGVVALARPDLVENGRITAAAWTKSLNLPPLEEGAILELLEAGAAFYVVAGLA